MFSRCKKGRGKTKKRYKEICCLVGEEKEIKKKRKKEWKRIEVEHILYYQIRKNNN